MKLAAMAFTAGQWWRLLATTDIILIDERSDIEALDWVNAQLSEWYNAMQATANECGGEFTLDEDSLASGNPPKLDHLGYGCQMSANGGEELFVVAIEAEQQARLHQEYYNAEETRRRA